ncbi:SDR family oxidoreductase (plasmid) [Kitasatospora sp. NBC_00070]|uniref:SDR family oxidoreductase n=1 Tax=Kitasatospora sp. NBC_00070 TaxID=2975962 RepID=UPI002F915B93
MAPTLTSARWTARHVLITGGSSGIGLALATGLQERGARVSVVARDADRLNALTDRPAPPGLAPFTARSADVADQDGLQHAITELTSTVGPVSDLITSAGTVRPGRFHELDDLHFREAIEVNYFGTLYAARAVLPAMLERRDGTITCISSAAGLYGLAGYASYAPSKFAVRGLCESLRMELRPHGIHVAAVYPGDVDTPQLAMEQPFKPPELAALAGTLRPARAATVADAVIRGIEARRPVIVPGTANRTVAILARLAPRLANAYADRIVAAALRHRPGVSPRP